MTFELWVEKYRPKTLDDVVGQDDIIRALKGFVEKRSMPHLLFAGPAGTGKTTTALALANDLYKSEELVAANYLELNASDERGIDTIRTKIKDFAKTAPFGEVPFKIIHLDEADNLTADAQQALRRIMEMYSATTRFIFACNYSSKIIEPIQSRCAVFRFGPIPEEAIKNRLIMIAEREGLKYTEDGISAIIYVAEGDLRKAINLLQTASAMASTVDSKVVYRVAGLAHPEEVRAMINSALKGKFLSAREALRNLMINYGMSAQDVIRQLNREIMASKSLSDKEKAMLMIFLSEVDFRVTEGAHGDVQLAAMLAKLVEVGESHERGAVGRET
ncbi:replication factor C small subunit [Candidatus Korarchaeum cryptofilum]|jgi:replication factor C small subunit|uniref:Replication factor C small subunit n=2 Tax=Candidatus Korarchaeum cryptofilum TaxID=498846 RepID=B1L5M9_KORCO|nr:replication factor C small subunit [Candidatus Korarchaeum cryptofilum]ACB07758.1 ATPase involved in DNA replication HolB, small subunit [Candidatus Korarchaeum cryptofilum OPF8]RSN70578.1 replication factor C small subunit [Candidatus Korarchaeum cryptofilum]